MDDYRQISSIFHNIWPIQNLNNSSNNFFNSSLNSNQMEWTSNDYQFYFGQNRSNTSSPTLTNHRLNNNTNHYNHYNLHYYSNNVNSLHYSSSFQETSLEFPESDLLNKNVDNNHFETTTNDNWPLTVTINNPKSNKSLKKLEVGKKRDLANIQERRRMHRLNDALDRLRKIIPQQSKQKRLSKIQILQSAIAYIRSLQDILNQ